MALFNKPKNIDGKKPLRPQKTGRNAARNATAETTVIYGSDGTTLLLNIALIQSVLIALVIGFLLYFSFFAPPAIRYFAALPTGQIIPMTSLDRPVDTDPVVLGWTANAASEIMTFNYRDYNERLSRSQRYFTGVGWKKFTQSLLKARYVNTLIDNKQIQSAVPREAPRIVDRCSGSCNPYYWEIQMPLLISVESQDKKGDTNRLVTFRIVRVPPTENPAGIQIDSWKEESQ